MTDRPWMAALEGRLAAFGADGYKQLQRQVARDESGVFGMLKARKYALLKAATFAWTDECRQAVEHVGQSVPLTTTIDAPPAFDPSWYWFGETAYTFTVTAQRYSSFHLCALLLAPVHDAAKDRGVLSMTAFGQPAGAFPPLPFLAWTWPFGSPLSDILTSITLHEGAEEDPDPAMVNLAVDCTRFVAAADAWLRQRILTTSPGPIERHRRKQLAREFDLDMPIEDVRVIHWRQTEHEPHASDEHRGVDWHCRWIVTGHWRHQACGAEHAERRLIYVMPHVKGPADMPLRVPTATVHLVDR